MTEYSIYRRVYIEYSKVNPPARVEIRMHAR